MKNDWNTSSAQELNKNNGFFYSCFVFGKSFCKGKSCRKLPRRTGRRRLLRRCREKILLREILQQGGACPMKNDWNTSSAQELNKNKRFFYLCFVFLKSGWAAAKIYPIKLALLIRREEVRHAPSRDFRCRERSIFSDWKSSSAQDMSKKVSFFYSCFVFRRACPLAWESSFRSDFSS